MSDPLEARTVEFGEPNPVVVPKTFTAADVREARAQALERAARVFAAGLVGGDVAAALDIVERHLYRMAAAERDRR